MSWRAESKLEVRIGKIFEKALSDVLALVSTYPVDNLDDATKIISCRVRFVPSATCLRKSGLERVHGG